MPLNGKIVADVNLASLQAVLDAIKSDKRLDAMFKGKPLQNIALVGLATGLIVCPLTTSGISAEQQAEFAGIIGEIMGKTAG
jgi:hypothetical protein